MSDLHIGNSKDSDIFHKITLDYADWLKNTLQEKGISKISILGDFFHDRTKITLPTLDTGHKFLDILKDFDVVISSGNHDCLFLDNSSVTSLSVFKTRKNVHIINENVENVGDITYVPWGFKLEDIPDNCKIIGCHIDAVSFEMSKGKVSTHGIKVSDLMKKCRLCFSGHYHKNQERTYDGKTFVYIGSPFALNFGEAGDKKFVHILDTETLAVEKIENTISPKFKYIHSENDISDIRGDFVSIVSSDPELVEKVNQRAPIFVRIELADKFKNTDASDEVKEFKIIDVPSAIHDFSNNLSDEWKLLEEGKKKVATEVEKMYHELK